jgi:hypothetical protein
LWNGLKPIPIKCHRISSKLKHIPINFSHFILSQYHFG